MFGPRVTVGEELSVRVLPKLPLLRCGDDVAALVTAAVEAGRGLEPCDVVVVASKLLSRAQGATVDLGAVVPGPQAAKLASEIDKDPRLVQVILDDSDEVSRAAPGVLITRHRLGHVSANAGIDTSNARPEDIRDGTGPWVLRLPADPDRTAREIRAALEAGQGVSPIGVIITDSLGRPFRNGSLGHVLGLAGLPALSDERGQPDLVGYTLEHTFAAIGDMVAAAADLVMGQGAQGRGAVVVRGLRFKATQSAASDLHRPRDRDLYC